MKQAKTATAALGQWAEQQAAVILRQQGFDILWRNYHSFYGEIDLIVSRGQELVFVEVKARSKSRYGRAQEVVSLSKQQKIIRTASIFLNQYAAYANFYCRFDVICFNFPVQIAKKVQQDFDQLPYDLEWIENAFTLDREFITL